MRPQQTSVDSPPLEQLPSNPSFVRNIRSVISESHLSKLKETLKETMGSSQSKLPEPAVGEKLAERLHAMEVKETRSELEKGYVYVEGEQRRSSGSYTWCGGFAAHIRV